MFDRDIFGEGGAETDTEEEALEGIVGMPDLEQVFRMIPRHVRESVDGRLALAAHTFNGASRRGFNREESMALTLLITEASLIPSALGLLYEPLD